MSLIVSFTMFNVSFFIFKLLFELLSYDNFSMTTMNSTVYQRVLEEHVSPAVRKLKLKLDNET